MNSLKKITLGLAALAAIGVVQAQQSSPSFFTSTAPSVADRPGVLGQSYTELSFGVEDLRHTSDNAYNADLRANVPITQGIDVGLGYGYSWLNSQTDRHSHLLATDAKFYLPVGNNVKPFLGGLVGYEWTRGNFDNEFPPITKRDDRWVWGMSTGVEVPVGTVALTPRIGYVDSMEGGSLGHYNYGVEAHHWFSQSVGGYADVGYNELRHEANTWTYLAGVRLRF